jgi:hypothetical protein
MTRTQCRECPWRDLATIPDYAMNAARNGNDGFVCHTRCGPCPGPALAGVLGTADTIGHDQ